MIQDSNKKTVKVKNPNFLSQKDTSPFFATKNRVSFMENSKGSEFDISSH